MCSLECLSASLPLSDSHTYTWVCVKEGQASCQDVGSSRGTVALCQKSQLSAETKYVSDFVSECVWVSVCACVLAVHAFPCNCPCPDCSDDWASILHFRRVIPSTIGNSSPTSKRLGAHTAAELSFINSSTAEVQMNLNKANYHHLSCNTVIVEGFTDLYRLRIIRPPRRRKKCSRDWAS